MLDVVRYYQANQMRESHHMDNVVIYRDKLSKAFEGQVMATYDHARHFGVVDVDCNLGQIMKILFPYWSYFTIRESLNLIFMSVLIVSRPEIMGTPHPVSKRIELHNTWLVSKFWVILGLLTDLRKADGLKHYVDWAATRGFGVIDVNVPTYLSGLAVC